MGNMKGGVLFDSGDDKEAVLQKLSAAGGVTNGVRFIWNAAADLPSGFKAQNVKVKVAVEK